MKMTLSIARRAISASFAALILTILFGAATARAQVFPFVDCVERVDDSNYRAYFGYVSFELNAVIIPADSSNNFFTPISNVPGHPLVFHPGAHRRVVSVVVPNDGTETWFLFSGAATATAQKLLSCTDTGINTRTITYQGRLSDAGAAASGQYDLRFQLFDAATGGASQSASVALENVSVANGVFTVQLDFGVLPAILDGGNLFLEIAVRPGTSTGSHTTLAPRQPLTAAPYAIRAQSAANADLLGGVSSSNFIRSDSPLNYPLNQVIKGNLQVTGTINGTVTNAANATNAINATNAAQLGGTAASQFVQTNDARLSDARAPTLGSANYIQNATTQQSSANFNISGSGTLGGTLTANTVNAGGTNNTPFRGTSSSTVGTRLALENTTTGGTTWNVISTGSANGEGAGKLIFFNETSNTVPLQINGGGANIVGNLTVTGTINGTVSNATNATNVSGGFVQLPLTTGAPPVAECDETAEYGRQKVDAGNVRLYVCTAAGWKYTALQ